MGDGLYLGGVEALEERLDRRAPRRGGDRQWPIPMCCDLWSDLPSVMRAGATMTSAFWNSFRLPYPQVAMDVLSAPKRLRRPSFSWAGPMSTSLSVPRVSVLTRAPRGRVGWKVAIPQW